MFARTTAPRVRTSCCTTNYCTTCLRELLHHVSRVRMNCGTKCLHELPHHVFARTAAPRVSRTTAPCVCTNYCTTWSHELLHHVLTNCCTAAAPLVARVNAICTVCGCALYVGSERWTDLKLQAPFGLPEGMSRVTTAKLPTRRTDGRCLTRLEMRENAAGTEQRVWQLVSLTPLLQQYSFPQPFLRTVVCSQLADSLITNCRHPLHMLRQKQPIL
jgi:hypothetical protein